MLTPIFLVPLVLPFLLGPVTDRVLARARPTPALWILTVGSAVLAPACAVSLGALVMTGLYLLPAFAHLNHFVSHLCTPSAHLMAGMAVLAACALAIGGVRFGYSAVRHGRTLRATRRKVAGLPVVGDLCIVDSPRPDAYALPGRVDRIVVTAGMLRCLRAAEREALFAHERAHNSGRHHYFLAIAEISAHCHPALHQVRAGIRLAAELAADEAAARVVGDRRLVAVAVARAALAGHDAGPTTRPHLTLGAATEPVSHRVASLLEPSAPSGGAASRRLAVVMALIVALSASATVAGVVHLRHDVGEAQGAIPR
ncbi:M48 family metalloprotease [Streptomyces sp. NPDC005827]|uniref:M48 family metalloprotease n=1 Tax=Streptomyces sp. NPDC005827 TaxID=3157070 RepID=UPI0033DA7AAF